MYPDDAPKIDDQKELSEGSVSRKENVQQPSQSRLPKLAVSVLRKSRTGALRRKTPKALVLAVKRRGLADLIMLEALDDERRRRIRCRIKCRKGKRSSSI
jgi:hypothetical protein